MNVAFFKEQFGFPLSYKPEGMEETMYLTEGQTLELYQKYEAAEYASVSLVMLALDRDLDDLYDQWLDNQ